MKIMGTLPSRRTEWARSISTSNLVRAGGSTESPADAKPLNTVPIVFDRNAKKMQRNRAALRPDSREVDYLRDEVADRVVDRLLVGVDNNG
jgi:NADH dehydrogenase [ubiquinone] 1 alpha subcomplex assembly factor 5